jgi:hypothetical protein
MRSYFIVILLSILTSIKYVLAQPPQPALPAPSIPIVVEATQAQIVTAVNEDQAKMATLIEQTIIRDQTPQSLPAQIPALLPYLPALSKDGFFTKYGNNYQNGFENGNLILNDIPLNKTKIFFQTKYLEKQNDIIFYTIFSEASLEANDDNKQLIPIKETTLFKNEINLAVKRANKELLAK